jgi:hypothetical protein
MGISATGRQQVVPPAEVEMPTSVVRLEVRSEDIKKIAQMKNLLLVKMAADPWRKRDCKSVA